MMSPLQKKNFASLYTQIKMVIYCYQNMTESNGWLDIFFLLPAVYKRQQSLRILYLFFLLKGTKPLESCYSIDMLVKHTLKLMYKLDEETILT